MSRILCVAWILVFGMAAHAADKPNLLFILSDDQVHTAIGSVNLQVKTPHIDELALAGTQFTHCFVSNPICTPSRAALLTGQYGFRNGVTFFGETIHDQSPRIARILSEAGYTTAFVGKWHNDGLPKDHGFNRAPATFRGGMNDFKGLPLVGEDGGDPVQTPGHPTTLITDAALKLLEEPLPEPFALFVWYTAPHDPRHFPPGFEKLYDPDEVRLPENFMPEPRFDPGTLDIRDEKLHSRPLDETLLREQWAKYFAMVSHVDAQVGRLLDSLNTSGKAAKTVVIYSSDNGLTLGSHGLLGKQTLYEEGIRVPLIIRGPGVPTGKRSSALVDLMDLMPTFCEFAGAAVSDAVQGRSLLPILREEKLGVREMIFAHYEDFFRMIRTHQYKYVSHLQTGREEFFDLERDPLELENQIEDEKYAEPLAEMKGHLAEAMADGVLARN